MEPILRAEKLTKRFGELTANREIDIEIHAGEIHAIAGENGAGKSTLMSILTGVLQPDAGEICINGKPVMIRTPKDALQHGIGMIYQHFKLVKPFSVAENIVLGDDHVKVINKKKLEARVKEVMREVGIPEEFYNRYPHQFSGGQRQRVGIARALIMNPKLIIADECISALDVSIQAQVVNLMKDIQAETQCAYLFIAHDLSMVKYISDRIGVLHLGYMVESGTKEEIFSHPVHPYTKSLLSAIPHPNPVVEKHRVALTYNYATSGIDYAKGTEHSVGGTHTVLATDEEFDAWTK